MQYTPVLLGLAAVFDLASANPRPAPARSVAGETGCGAYGIYCDTPNTFSLCVPTAAGGTQYFYFGSVAQGTYCDTVEERIRADNYGNCAPDGQIFCGIGGLTFFECDQGGMISFGPTAAGTECINGQIVACNGKCGTTTTSDGPTTSATIANTFSTSTSSSFTPSSTSSGASPSTTTSLGYYPAPANGNLLGGPVASSPAMTRELCGSQCQGYPYFALSNGKNIDSLYVKVLH